MIRSLILVLACVLVGGQGHAQPSSENVRGEKEIWRDTIVESGVFQPDSLIRDTLRYEYTKIKNAAYRWKWTKELYKMIFVNPKKYNIDIVQSENSEDRYKKYKGKIIRDIYVKILPPFGTSVRDTIYEQDSLDWLRMMANNVHQKSSERIVKKQLTVKPGMAVDPFELVENEVLLKRLSNIDDVLIEIEEIPGNSDEVNLLVICKDEFSWTGEVWSNFLNAADIGIESKNLFKRGHQVHYRASYRGRKDQRWGNLIEYQVDNLFSTRVDFYGSYENTYVRDMLTLSLNRPFQTSRTKWAGGIGYSRIYSSSTLVDRDITKPVELFNYRLFDTWIGRSFYLGEKYSFTRNLYLTGRYMGTQFVNRPIVTSDSNSYYYNRSTFIGAIAFMKLKYFKANLIYDFGRTEDIPSGLYGALLYGYERGDFTKNGYLGTEWHYSWFNKYTNRFYAFHAALGSFMDGYDFESGVFKLGASYFSRLYHLSKHRLRFYSSMEYVKGIKRNNDDYIYFEDSKITGFDTDTLQGNQRLSGSLSTTLFLPYIKRGFRASLTGFVDAGALAEGNKSILKAQTYWAVGVSVNLRNDNLIFKNVSIRLTYYPKVPPGFHSFDVDISSRRRTGFFDYRISKPETIKYE
ncbi:hypothetical protein [uncultured Sanguibacteroides sp.]|uniref:hypothetical protein n=1 Tax=uncultured Sanguibacteroides sp. TaxID=1635151 RepID=UPI0025E972C3|nr:hypothetical protein [uncultured Sanguibacteroides sp.]